jgi:membrane peptidoglycan carboxypeptidase
MSLKNALQVSANTVSLQLFQKIDADEFRKKIAIAFEHFCTKLREER